jgi:uncharacterized protein (TIGR03086 family)
VAPLTSGLQLLESVVGYALAAASRATPQLLARPTPCSAWDLAMLLDHVSDSIEVVHEAMATDQVRSAPPPGLRHDEHQADPIGRLRRQAALLRHTCSTAGSDDRLITIGDRQLTARCVALTGAMEIAVHGWDISAACGNDQPVPPGVAAVLLSVAPLIVPVGIRPGLFAEPVRLSAPACPGDHLVAFLGRKPRAAATFPGSAGLPL